jgi:hypothetical protein
VADHSRDGRDPVQAAMLMSASVVLLKDCPLTGPSHAAESRLNQPAEFVARAGSWFR